MRSRVALGEGQADRTPVVHHEAHALDLELGQEALEEVPVLIDRVAQGAGLARASEAGQVRRQAAGPLEEWEPVVRVVRHAVQVQRGAAPVTPAGAGALRQKTGSPSSSSIVIAHLGHGARI